MMASRRSTWSRAARSGPISILADYNLPNGMNGLELTPEVAREVLGGESRSSFSPAIFRPIPLREIAARNYVQLNKPVKPAELTEVISTPSPRAPAVAHAALPTRILPRRR